MSTSTFFESAPSGIFHAVARLDHFVFIPTEPHIPAVPGNPVFPAGPASYIIDALTDFGPGTTLAVTDHWSL